MRLDGLLPALLMLIICLAPCLAAGQSPGRVGAYMNLRDGSPDGIEALVNEAAAAGVQFLLPIGKSTSGRAYYRSEIAPPARPDSPDALQLVIEAAHTRGLKVHPWLCVNSDGGETAYSPALEAHPDWCVVNADGHRAGYIDPSSQEARDYVCSIVRELVEKYDVDGISTDYARYPSGRNCFCERCVRLFREATGYDARSANLAKPGTDEWRQWRAWRMKQINEEMAQIRKTVDEVKPGLPISSYVWGVHTYGSKYQTCQDWKTWIKRGYINWINPSGYVYKMVDFRKRVKENREAVPEGFPCLVTIGVTTSHGKLNSSAEVREQVEEAMKLGADGVVFFTLEYTRPYLKDLTPLLRELASKP